MMTRVDSLLAELGARHRTGDAFLEQLRPMVERILDPGTPEAARPDLLELVAESCERHVTIEKNCKQAVAAWNQFAAHLKAALEELVERRNRDRN